MPLVRLIYASSLPPAFDPAEVDNILSGSRRRNPSLDVTGLLCFTTEHFIQCLEGPRSAVNDIYRHIVQDRRHSRVEVLDFREVDQRVFENWSMAYMGLSDIGQKTMQRYCPSHPWDPYRLDAQSAHEMMLLLATRLGPEARLG